MPCLNQTSQSRSGINATIRKKPLMTVSARPIYAAPPKKIHPPNTNHATKQATTA